MRQEGKDLANLQELRPDNLKTILNTPILKNSRFRVKCSCCGKLFVSKPPTIKLSGFLCKACKMSKTKQLQTKERKTEIKEKMQATNLKKYGCKCPLQNKDIEQKTKTTLLTKFGVEHQALAKAVREKTEKTNLERYGSKSTFKSESIKSKIKQTMLSRYGVEFALQSSIIREREKQTCQERYGTNYSFQAATVKEKIRKTNLKRYGVENVMQTPEQQARAKACWASKSAEEKRQIRKKAAKKYFYEGENFDSSWELAVWIYAKDYNEEIEREPCSFEYTLNEKKHLYFPDFRYKGKLIEIKGEQLLGKDSTAAKLLCAKENGVDIWYSQDLQKYLNYMKAKEGYYWYRKYKVS